MRLSKWIRSSLNLKHIITIIAAMACLVAAMFLFSNSIASVHKYQAFLNSRNYNYSVVVDKNLDSNCYALYNKTITFSKNESLNSTINAVTLMKTSSAYDEDDFLYGYNCELLGNEILISNNIAIINGIKPGMTVYSRSKITTSVEPYIVKGVIPDVFGINETDTNMGKGIIVVGESNEYLNNIQTDYIYFYNTDYSKINQQGANITGALNNTEKTKTNLFKSHLFFSSITAVLMALTTSITAVLLMAFNFNVYLKKKEYGIPSLGKIVLIDLLVYFGLIIMGGSVVYAISSMFIRFAFESLLSFVSILCIAFICSYFCVKKIMKGR
jgi:hypothetical protein